MNFFYSKYFLIHVMKRWKNCFAPLLRTNGLQKWSPCNIRRHAHYSEIWSSYDRLHVLQCLCSFQFQGFSSQLVSVHAKNLLILELGLTESLWKVYFLSVRYLNVDSYFRYGTFLWIKILLTSVVCSLFWK